MRALLQARKLKLMAFDVDGVLTDGTLYFTAQGDEMKAFNSLDGHGLKMLAGAGVMLAIITGRRSRAVELRAQNLDIAMLLQGVEDKYGAMQGLLDEHGLGFDDAGYMGDDVVDLPLLSACGFSAATARAGVATNSSTKKSSAPAPSPRCAAICTTIRFPRSQATSQR